MAGYQVNICLSVVTHAIYSLYLAVDTGYLSLTSHLSHTCTLVHPYSHSHTHTHTRLIYTYMCTGTHTYMCIHKHVTHTHTHTHTHAHRVPCSMNHLSSSSSSLLATPTALGFQSYPSRLSSGYMDHTHCRVITVITHDICILPVQLRQVAKTTPLSWLRMQLKQLIEKVCHIFLFSILPVFYQCMHLCVLNIVSCMCVRWKR